PKCKMVFTAARLVPVKALHLMVEAFTKSGLPEKGWVWVIAGNGPLRTKLESQAGALNRHAIRFLGLVEPVDIPALMAQSELFVLPSVYEPHGIALTEAMAVGTPVIAADCCGAARDLVRQGKTGWLFKTGDRSGLLAALRLATQESGKLAVMRPACRNEFVRWYGRYSPLVMIPRIAGKLLALRRSVPRVIWLQNQADHYFVQMLDALNATGDVEYFGVFLCPPPQGNVLYQTPKISPYIFLGDPATPPGPANHRHLGKEAREYIKKLEFFAAIVGGYDSRFKLWVLRHCQSRGIPTALFADSNIRAERGRDMKKRAWRSAKRLFLRTIINRVDRIIPCNRSGVAYWRYYGCPSSKIARSTYFCAVDVPAAQAANREEIFARYELDPKCNLIFTAARLVPAKALHLMVEAFSRSGLADKGWVWAVAGAGPLRQELESQAAERSRRTGTIRFLGPVKPADIPGLMAQSQLFVLPSIYEPHGIVVTEAMAVGTPVITGDCCGAARDLVRPGRTGWLFKTGDATSLRMVLAQATHNAGQLAEIRGVCREEFRKWYNQYGPVQVVPKLAADLFAKKAVVPPPVGPKRWLPIFVVVASAILAVLAALFMDQ
ncbi:MAG: glycosyltransferase, partial [Phycisphaerae bacterium]